jgi:biopolymer transport protein ExbB
MRTRRWAILVATVFGLGSGLLSAPALTMGESRIDSAAGTARSDLEEVLGELRQSRAAIAEEKIPLVRRQRELEAEVARQRREFQRQQRERDGAVAELESLRSVRKRLEDQYLYQQGLVGEYVRALETALPVSEIEGLAPLLRIPAPSAEDGEAPSLVAALGAVQLSLDRILEQIGGRSFAGEAVGAEGVIEAGDFFEIGPVILFSGDQLVGFAEERVGSLKAYVSTSEREHAAAIRQLGQSKQGILPFDPTLGQATRRAEARTSFAEWVQAGGVVMIPILLLALVSFIIAMLKWVQIAGVQVASPALLQEILGRLEKGDTRAAAQRAGSVRGPVGELLRVAVENAHERREILEEVLYERILQAQPRLERYLPFLALTAAAAPLLGLLGTVTGMINTFQLITLFGTGDARTLSGGISEALITTQFGLGVAIVALLAHALLSRKAKGVIANMEQTELAVCNGLSGSNMETDGHG